MNPLLSTNVPDPTDFPPQSVAPGLRELDASLRCNICGEVYDGPVTLNCGHSFCSQCIRSSLAEKQECPTCRKTAIEGHIRPNSVVEEIISNWNISRPYLLDLIKQKDEWKRDSTPITPKAKKRKVSPETENRRRVSTSTLASPSKHKRIKQSSSILFATIPTSDAEEDELREPDKEPGLDDQVDCPLCGKRVKFKTINLHMDKGCKDSPPISVKSTTSTSDWKKLMAKPSATTKGKQKDNDSTNDDYPLPKASYDTLKDKKIKEMLVEYGLPTSGDRNLWIQRHQR
ncbi:hypothetical protein C0991_004364 [Blastosporella zonata]|nr:hypothetical protein C0991_004364 [Blastosporella zonata]